MLKHQAISIPSANCTWPISYGNITVMGKILENKITCGKNVLDVLQLIESCDYLPVLVVLAVCFPCQPCSMGNTLLSSVGQECLLGRRQVMISTSVISTPWSGTSSKLMGNYLRLPMDMWVHCRLTSHTHSTYSGTPLERPGMSH